MISYRFIYSDASGGVIRLTQMQCASDAEAVRRARETMQDKYAALEIFAGERAVETDVAVPA
ncbi:MAG TPA: hypothetical protein VNU97_01285 [Rhizomicrobium sp.]|jgi:hypothetical protein|nr:hypothetical protein [Rhizomicrobium sp.]